MKNKTINESKADLLLRRVYNVIEMSHLNDHKLNACYRSDEIEFPKKLGEDIFNYLQSKSEMFKEIVLKRQKRYRNRMKKKKKEGE